MDTKSYLLDFKSLTNEETEANNSALLGSTPTPVQTGNVIVNLQNGGHHTMEFFEMCAALIIQLAR